MSRRKERQLKLERTVALLQHKWGQDAIRQGIAANRPVPHLATGFPTLDAALGIGGIPQGRMTVLEGTPTSGKVTLAALILANAQKRLRRPVAYVDVSHTCDADYLERCGLRLPDLLVVRPQDGRQALELTQALAGRVEMGAILFDHWAALGRDAAVQDYAAGMLAQWVGTLARQQTTLLVLDEPANWWKQMAEGRRQALASYAAVRLTLTREQWFYDGADIRGYQARVAIAKNKVGPTHSGVRIEVHFNGTVRGEGI